MPLVLEERARRTTFDPLGTLKLAAQSPQFCKVSGCQAPAQLTSASTPARGWFATTWAWTHQSLPCTLLKLAVKEGADLQATMAASWSDGGIHWRHRLRSVAPVVEVARSCTTVPCGTWIEAAHPPQDCLDKAIQGPPLRLASTFATVPPVE